MIKYIILFLFLLTGCKVTKPLTKEVTDSTIVTHRVENVKVVMPADSATFSFNIFDLLAMYRNDTSSIDTTFVKKSSHSSVNIGIKGGVVTATAKCDSLEMLVEVLNTTIERFRNEKTTIEVAVEKRLNWLQYASLYTGYGVLGVIGLTLLVCLIYVIFKVAKMF